MVSGMLKMREVTKSLRDDPSVSVHGDRTICFSIMANIKVFNYGIVLYITYIITNVSCMGLVPELKIK